MNKNDMLKHTCSFMLAFKYIVVSIVLMVFALTLLKEQHTISNKYTETMEQYFNVDKVVDNILSDGVPADFDEVMLRMLLSFMAVYGGSIALIYHKVCIVLSIYRIFTICAYTTAAIYFMSSISAWVRGYNEYKIEREILQVI